MATQRNFKYALQPFLRPTILSVTTEDVNWPATNLHKDFIPKRPYRTTTKTANQDIIFDFGSATQVGAVLVRWVNFPNILVGSSPDNVTYTNISPPLYTIDLGGLVITKDDDVDRRSLLVDLTSLFNHRYMRWRLPANMTTDDSAPYYSIGGMSIATSLVQFPGFLTAPLAEDYPKPAQVSDFPNRGKQVNESPDKLAFFELGWQHVAADVLSHIRAMEKVGKSPMIVFPNIRTPGNFDSFTPHKAYLMRRLSDNRRTSEVIVEAQNYQFQFEEVI